MTSLSVPANVGSEVYPPFRSAIICLLGLMAACFVSYLDRQILSLLVQPIKQDLRLSDVQIGVLQGMAFALSYSLLALPFGWLADRSNRTWLVSGGVTIWSIATFASGYCQNFYELALCRALVGAGEATLMPAAYSLLADYFPPRYRGRAFAAFMSAVFLGGGAALLVGGVMLRALSDQPTVLLPLLGEMAVWKAAFVIVSLPGPFIALILLALREPPRLGRVQAAHGAKDISILSYVREHPCAFFTVFGAYALFTLVSFIVGPWAPTLMIRNHGLDAGSAGMISGAVYLCAGILGGALSGVIGDRWVVQNRRGGRLPLIYFAWLFGFPSLAVFALVSDVRVAIAGFFVNGIVSGMAYVASSAIIQEMVPGNLRGRVTALWYLSTGIVGFGLGPVLTGFMTDHVFRSETALPMSMLALTGPCLLVGLLLTLMGTSAYDKARSQFA